MKVLHVITDDDRRGAQLFAADLHAQMQRVGADSSIVALAPGLVGGLDVECLGPARRSRKTLRTLRGAIRGADVVCLHGSTALPMGVIAGLGLDTAMIYRQISDPLFWAPAGRRRWQTRFLLRRMDAIVALGDQPATALRTHLGVEPQRVRIIPNGVPASRFPVPTEEDRRRERRNLGVESELCVVYLGALVPEKGVDVVIDATTDMSGVQLMIAGDGPERANLEARAHGAVRFLGSVDRPVDLLHAADALVLPSRGGDSMPAVIIEASLVGVPTIATRIGAIEEMIEDMVSGVLLDHAEPSTLATAIRVLADRPVQRRAMGAAAQETARQRYEIEPVTAAWLEACTVAVQQARSS